MSEQASFRLDYRFLLLEESEAFRNMVLEMVEKRDLGLVEEAQTISHASEILKTRPIDAAILQYRPDEGGFQGLLDLARKVRPDIGIVLLTSEDQSNIPREVREQADFLFNKVLDSSSRLADGLDRLLLQIGSSIMVVDERLSRLRTFLDRLRSWGFRGVHGCESGLDALLKHPTVSSDLILVDSNMASLPLEDFLREIRKEDQDVRVVSLLRQGDEGRIAEFLLSGVNDCIPRSSSEELMIAHVLRQLHISREQSERRRLREELEERDRKTKLELRLAANIQRQMLPSDVPEYPGYRFAAVHFPSHEIGGDVYGFYRDEEGRLTILFADNSGHGIPAALLSIAFKIYADILIRQYTDPVEFLSALGSSLFRVYPPEAFASTFYLRLEPNGKALFAKASQEPGLLAKPDGEVLELEAEGLVLGLFENETESGIALEPRELTLEPGERIVLYTDGVTEAADESGEEFGLERLKVLLSRLRGHSPHEICEIVPAALCKFRGRDTFVDDMTMLVIERI